MYDVLVGANQEISFPERPLPRARDGWVLVRLISVPMCNEYRNFSQGQPLAKIGHEASGIVEDAGDSLRFKKGDRVVVMPQLSCGTCAVCLSGEFIHCRNNLDSRSLLGDDAADATFAPYMLKPDTLLIAVPDDCSLDHAAMACCGLGPSFGAAERLRIRYGETVLVAGLGPVGLGAVVNCVYRGARVAGVDMQPYRRELALELGADIVLDPSEVGALEEIRDWSGDGGVQAALECSGAEAAQEFCIQAAGIKGRVACIGSSHGNASVGLGREVLFKGLTILGSWHYNLSSTHKLLRQIVQVGDSLDKMITHRFPLRSVREAWDLQSSGRCGKVILQPWA